MFDHMISFLIIGIDPKFAVLNVMKNIEVHSSGKH